MKKTKEGIPVVNRQELNLILDRMQGKVSKGVVLMGKPGVGKTTIMKERCEGRLMLSSNEIATYYMLDGIQKFVNPQAKLMFPVSCIDDLGTEIISSNYGNKLDLIPYLIQLLYQQGGEFVFYTTNLSYEELKERYGARVVDRLQEKCYFFILEDEPFRKLTTAEKINEELQ